MVRSSLTFSMLLPLLLNLQSAFGNKSAPEFSKFKSQTDITFQNWRKFITGVQAAYPEIQILTPDFPQPTDTPDIYMSKARGILEQARDIEGQILDVESQRGYRTGELKSGSPFSKILAKQEALDAIRKGASEEQVRQRFLQEFGEKL